MNVDVTPNEFPVLQSKIEKHREKLTERYQEYAERLKKIEKENEGLSASLEVLKDMQEASTTIRYKIKSNCEAIQSYMESQARAKQILDDFNKAVRILWKIVESTCSHEYVTSHDDVPYGDRCDTCKFCGDER